MMTSKLELITKEKAIQYLARNKMNRPLRSSHVEFFARIILAGDWKVTHQGIAFDENGNLLDGQHRLSAIALTGIPCECMVTRDLNRDDASAIDTQMLIRSYYDSHVFDGQNRPAAWLNTKVLSAVRTVVSRGCNARYVLSNGELDRLFAAWAKEIDKLHKASCGRGKSAGSSVNGAFLAALLNGVSEEDIHSFYSVLVNGSTTGSYGRNVQAPFKLARAIMAERERGGKTSTEKFYNLAQNAVWQYINAESTTILKTTNTLRYPVRDRIADVLKIGGNNNA